MFPLGEKANFGGAILFLATELIATVFCQREATSPKDSSNLKPVQQVWYLQLAI